MQISETNVIDWSSLIAEQAIGLQKNNWDFSS